MPTIEVAIATYVRAYTERDPAARAKLIEACWAADGRLVTLSREIRGRAALAEEMARLDSRLIRIRLISAVDAGKTTFRVRAVADLHDGTSPEAFDAGEVDADGRISLILTFPGPLADAAS
jgi:hypothetical protein